MGKKSSRELVGDIAGVLTNDPQSIQEISDAVNADRQSVTKYLEELRDAGIVKEKKSGRSRTFYVSEYEDNETYFRLPLENEQRTRLKALFKTIHDKYGEQFDKTPGKLMSQKIAVKVIGDLGLDLPFGRYRYGSITAMNFTPGDGNNVGPVDFGPDFGTEDVEDKVEETVEDFGTRGFEETRMKQYEDEDMELYLLKEEVMADLAGNIEDKSEFEKKLYRFLAKTPELDDKVDEALVDFISVSTDLLDKPANRAKVIQAFQDFWDLIAFYCLKEDLSKYYSEETLEDRIGTDRENKWDEVEEVLNELISLHESEISKPDVDDELKKLQGSAKELSEEEKESSENSSDLAGEFGLDS